MQVLTFIEIQLLAINPLEGVFQAHSVPQTTQVTAEARAVGNYVPCVAQISLFVRLPMECIINYLSLLINVLFW